MSLFKEFRPALLFLAKFLAIYFIGNILYGLFIETYKDHPDPITSTVTRQSAQLLNVLGYDTSTEDYPNKPKVAMKINDHYVLNVYEGCNGINVMIVFMAFLFAFGGRAKALTFFIPMGLLIIHITNLFRIALLFDLSLDHPDQFYFFHK